jgi:hypothetical protein
MARDIQIAIVFFCLEAVTGGGRCRVCRRMDVSIAECRHLFVNEQTASTFERMTGSIYGRRRGRMSVYVCVRGGDNLPIEIQRRARSPLP